MTKFEFEANKKHVELYEHYNKQKEIMGDMLQATETSFYNSPEIDININGKQLYTNQNKSKKEREYIRTKLKEIRQYYSDEMKAIKIYKEAEKDESNANNNAN